MATASAAVSARQQQLALAKQLLPKKGLTGSEREIEELAAFYAGPGPYVWWQGKPRAGKTALAAWFVVNPPRRVQVVSYFI